MKKNFGILSKLGFLLAMILIIACGKKNTDTTKQLSVDLNTKGGVPDKIIFRTVKDKNSALNEITGGNSDLFLSSVSQNMLNGLDNGIKENLDTYQTPELWSLTLNPVPNKAPYQVNVKGSLEFNPFAIRELRYALNYLLNRKYVANEILKGAGGVNTSPVVSGKPNAYKFELQAKKLGISEMGNKAAAIKDINKAMERAASLAENQGKLMKKNGFWYFLGKPVTLKFVIQNDDSEEKIQFGNYFAALLETSGIKVEKLMISSDKAAKTVYETDPAALSWSIYTENIKEKPVSYWQEIPVVKNMSSVLGNQPGWGEPNWWNYKNTEADGLAARYFNGTIQTDLEYWSTLLKLNEIGLREAVRIYAVYQLDNFVTNKNKFHERLFYGLDSGIGRSALENAYTKDGLLNVLQLSQNGKQFSSYWNPIGASGFSDANSTDVIQMLFDDEITETPFGQKIEKRSSVVEAKVKPEFQRDPSGVLNSVIGSVEVPEDAMVLDKTSSTFRKIGKGTKAAIETTYRINFGMWHHGREVKKSDYIYAEAASNEWAAKTAYYRPEASSKIASKWNADNTLTIWSNRFSPKGVLNNLGDIPSLKINGSFDKDIALPWEIMEGVKTLMLEGSRSKTVYGISGKPGEKTIDFKDALFIKDLKAKLQELSARKYIPAVLSGKVTQQEAVDDYKMAIKFIETYGHPLIGNGPFMLTKLDLVSGYAELSAFRNVKYTEEKGKWAENFRAARLRIDEVILPEKIETGRKLEIVLKISQVDYPSDLAKEARNGWFRALFINKNNEEILIWGDNQGTGNYIITLDEETAKGFHGAYTVIFTAGLDDKYTSTKIVPVVFQENQ